MGSCARSRGRGVVRRFALMGPVVGLVLLAGCAVGGAEVEGASPEPRAALAAKAELAAQNLARATRDRPARAHDRSRPRPGTGAKAGGAAGGKYAGTVDTAARAGSSAPDDSGSWAPLTSYEDPVDDHGDGPGYADLATVELGEADDMLIAAVTLDAVVPASLADREVEGVGIDLYRSVSDESDYQVFLDGGRHGWRAFLQTPSGFVRFPGSLSLRGDTLRAWVPWDAVGGREDAEVSVFVDWSAGVGRLSSDGTPRFDLLPER